MPRIREVRYERVVKISRMPRWARVSKPTGRCGDASFALPGPVCLDLIPRLTPWAAFFRRFAAPGISYSRVEIELTSEVYSHKTRQRYRHEVVQPFKSVSSTLGGSVLRLATGRDRSNIISGSVLEFEQPARQPGWQYQS